jgi:hypothetical protein
VAQLGGASVPPPVGSSVALNFLCNIALILGIAALESRALTGELSRWLGQIIRFEWNGDWRISGIDCGVCPSPMESRSISYIEVFRFFGVDGVQIGTGGRVRDVFRTVRGMIVFFITSIN